MQRRLTVSCYPCPRVINKVNFMLNYFKADWKFHHLKSKRIFLIMRILKQAHTSFSVITFGHINVKYIVHYVNWVLDLPVLQILSCMQIHTLCLKYATTPNSSCVCKKVVSAFFFFCYYSFVFVFCLIFLFCFVLFVLFLFFFSFYLTHDLWPEISFELCILT